MTNVTAVVIEVPAIPVPLPLVKPAALQAAPTVPAVQPKGGALPVEVLDSCKVSFPCDEFAHFDTFVDVFDDEGEGFLYPDLATAGLWTILLVGGSLLFFFFFELF